MLRYRQYNADPENRSYFKKFIPPEDTLRQIFLTSVQSTVSKAKYKRKKVTSTIHVFHVQQRWCLNGLR